jgi:3',5'-cyclic AMP phosphodiesterase CpdA
MDRLRIVHLSDLHVWRWTWDPRELAGKRAIAMIELLLGRARRFRREQLPRVVDAVLARSPDHVLITGDLSMSSMEREFAEAKVHLEPILADRELVTVLPGNHDRYTRDAARRGLYEQAFGMYAPRREYPWLRWLDADTAILGLDPCRPALTASGRLPETQLAEARRLVETAGPKLARLIVACHYPFEAPAEHALTLARKPLVNASDLAAWLRELARPHLYCCGHVHKTWLFEPHRVPGQLCVNPGPPSEFHDRPSDRPGFLELDLDGEGVRVTHHGWDPGGAGWSVRVLGERERFFRPVS